MYLTKRATFISAILVIVACQSTAAQQSVPTCEQARSSSVHQSRPDVVRMAYPDATYVGQGREAEALVRNGQLRCAVAALDHNGNIIYRPR